MTSTSTSRSPYGPYVRTGRGGAGNFKWESPNTDDSRELEAQTPSTLSEEREAAATIEHIDTGTAMREARSRLPPSQYIRAGRGGSGNMLLQSQPPETLRISSDARDNLSSATSPVMFTGRGGAGNHAAVSTSKAQIDSAREQDERTEAQKQRAQAEFKVESFLPPPCQAWLGGRPKTTTPEEVELHDLK